LAKLFPVKVSSPVIATLLSTFQMVYIEAIGCRHCNTCTWTIFGVAPSGTWRWRSYLLYFI